jgi:hypothetical protein
VTLLHFLFVLTAFFAVYIQTKSYALSAAVNALQGSHPEFDAEYVRLLRIRRFMSPFIAGLAAGMVMLGAFVFGNTTLFLGILLSAVWVMAALGDIFIEGSYSIDDESVKARYYIIGMALFIVFTLGLGVGLIINAAVIEGALPAYQILVAAGVSIAMGVIAYQTLNVAPETFAIMLVYTVSVTVLLCGGILSALTGNTHLAYIGIAYFVSDWCVGLRDFGKNIPTFLKNNILIIILMLYYSIMLMAIDFVF